MTDRQVALDTAQINLNLAWEKLQLEGASIPLWDAVHFAEDKIANLEARP